MPKDQYRHRVDDQLKFVPGLGQVGLALPQCIFNPLAIVDVERDTVPFDDLALLVAQRHAANPVPSVVPIGSSQPLFQLERLAPPDMPPPPPLAHPKSTELHGAPPATA